MSLVFRGRGEILATSDAERNLIGIHDANTRSTARTLRMVQSWVCILKELTRNE